MLITSLAYKPYTVKLTRAKLLANANNITCGSHVKRPHTQFTSVTCSLHVKTGKLVRVYAASTSRRTHANCLHPHVNLPEYNGHFTGNFTCRTHVNLLATGMQNCLLLQEKNPQLQAVIRANAGKNAYNCSQKYPQLLAKKPGVAGNLQSHLG